MSLEPHPASPPGSPALDARAPSSQTLSSPHPILACLVTLAGALDQVAHLDAAYLPGASKRLALLELGAVGSRVEELRLRILAAGQTLGDVADDDGSRDAAAWLGHAGHLDPGRARHLTRLATALNERWTKVGGALREGRLDLERAAVIVRALDELPDELEPDLIQRAEETLIEQAEHFDPRRLRILGRRVLTYLAPDVAEAFEAKALADEDAHAAAVTFLRTRSRCDGTTDIHARVADHVARRLETYLCAFTSPRRPDQRPGQPTRSTTDEDHPDRSDAGRPDPDRPDAESADAARPDATRPAANRPDANRGDPGRPRDQGSEGVAVSARHLTQAATSVGEDARSEDRTDRRPWDRRLGEALGSLLESVDPQRLPLHGGDATTVVVTIDLSTLTGGSPRHDATPHDPTHDLTHDLTRRDLSPRRPRPLATPAGVASIGDQPLSAGQARRLACTAGIIPAVLGGESQVLDLGRRRRLFTAAQRRALAVRHPTCAAHGCTIPAPWCEAHHAGQPWAHGGRTDLDDGVLLCSHHHHRAHDQRYDTTRRADGAIDFHRRT